MTDGLSATGSMFIYPRFSVRHLLSPYPTLSQQLSLSTRPLPSDDDSGQSAPGGRRNAVGEPPQFGIQARSGVCVGRKVTMDPFSPHRVVVDVPRHHCRSWSGLLARAVFALRSRGSNVGEPPPADPSTTPLRTTRPYVWHGCCCRGGGNGRAGRPRAKIVRSRLGTLLCAWWCI